MIDFRTVKASVSLSWLCDCLGIRVRQTATPRARGPCPVRCCRGRECCTYYVDQGRWSCRACGRTGDMIDLVALVRGVELIAAARELCELAGVRVPYLPRREPRTPRNRKRLG